MEIRRFEKKVYRYRIFIVLIVCLLFVSLGSPPVFAGCRDELPESSAEVCPVLVGTEIPKVILTSLDGSPFDLFSEVSGKPSVVIFYRGGW